MRPGAVPGRNLHLVSDLQSVDKKALDRCKVAKNLSLSKKKQASKENKTILSSERESNLNDKEDSCNKTINVRYHIHSESQNYEENDESKNVRILEDISVSRYSSQLKKLRYVKKEPIEIFEYNNNPVNPETVEGSIKKCNSSKKYSAYIYLKNKDVDDALQMTNDLKTRSKIDKNEILFEDFLEVYTEVSIPRGWSCLVTSKGHGTTVVYLCMSLTTDGLPFVEKQVFIKSDMILHYAIANREIDPLMHNLVTERKFTKVRNLVDIEILIDEFNQRVVCQGNSTIVYLSFGRLNYFCFFPKTGIYNPVNYEDIDIIKVVHKDGIKWRHIFCPLIMNNDSSRCTKCTILSRMLLLQKS